MNRIMSRLACGVSIVGITLLGAGCGPTEYKAAGPLDETGYQTTQLTDDRYLVSFEGNAETSRQRVETYLLYRAAEVAAQTGHPYFALVEEETEREVELNTYYTSPGFYGYGPGLGFNRGFGGFPYYTTFGYGPGPVVSASDSYEAYATVEMLNERPADRPDVFETSNVIRTLAPQIESS